MLGAGTDIVEGDIEQVRKCCTMQRDYIGSWMEDKMSLWERL